MFAQGVANLDKLSEIKGLKQRGEAGLRRVISKKSGREQRGYESKRKVVTYFAGFSWLKVVSGWSPALYGLISGFLPALSIIVLFALLPQFLESMPYTSSPFSLPHLLFSPILLHLVTS